MSFAPEKLEELKVVEEVEVGNRIKDYKCFLIH
jgi:hypothetical protein